MENQLTIVLSRNKLLKNVDIKKIDLNRIKGRLFTISEGQIIYREGDSADLIFLVINGEINLLKKRMLGKPKSYIFTDNDFFGHDEFFEETTRFSTAVALRDSYLISLSKNEVDELIKQDDEIYVNLRQPPEEIEQELLRSTFESPQKKTFESEPRPVKEPENKKNDEDFFKSFAATNSYDNSKIIQPIESIENPLEPEINVTEQKFEEVFLNEDGIPKAEVDLTNVEESEFEKGIPFESNEEIKFEESSLLNEDGIPKPEFELPETPQLKEPIQQSYSELDDALFSILSGGESPVINPSADKTNESIPDITLFQKN